MKNRDESVPNSFAVGVKKNRLDDEICRSATFTHPVQMNAQTTAAITNGVQSLLAQYQANQARQPQISAGSNIGALEATAQQYANQVRSMPPMTAPQYQSEIARLDAVIAMMQQARTELNQRAAAPAATSGTGMQPPLAGNVSSAGSTVQKLLPYVPAALGALSALSGGGAMPSLGGLSAFSAPSSPHRVPSSPSRKGLSAAPPSSPRSRRKYTGLPICGTPSSPSRRQHVGCTSQLPFPDDY